MKDGHELFTIVMLYILSSSRGSSTGGVSLAIERFLFDVEAEIVGSDPDYKQTQAAKIILSK